MDTYLYSMGRRRRQAIGIREWSSFMEMGWDG